MIKQSIMFSDTEEHVLKAIVKLRKDNLSKGFAVPNVTVRIGQMDRDFVYSMTSILASGFTVKVPRILSQRLIKKYVN